MSRKPPTVITTSDLQVRPVETMRGDAGLTLDQIAQRLGVTRGSIWQAQRRGQKVELATLQKIAEACGFELRLTLRSLKKPRPH